MKFEPDILTMRDKITPVNAANAHERRKELLDILAHEEYGYMPPVYGKSVCVEKKSDIQCAGHAIYRELDVTVPCEKGDFTFPVKTVLPNDGKKHPTFLFLNFRGDMYDQYCPVEEVIDSGFGVVAIYYKVITTDDNNMNDGLCGMFNRPADGTGFGKISIWAYAASRVLDAIQGFDEIDFDNIAVIGHSRLGKTALWCGANDDRIKYVISNDSGCGGAAFERTKHEGGETIESMNNVFPFWFCENRQKYAGKENEMPFDQHFLIGASAPRYVCVGSASLDNWADQYSEQLSCVGASPLFKVYDGVTDIPEKQVEVGCHSDSGHISYHMREGKHFLSRNDWNDYIRYIKTVM